MTRTFASNLRRQAALCEGRPIESLVDVLRQLARRHRPCTIAITGPSAVGKSTLARKLLDSLVGEGRHPTILPTDSFLREALRGQKTYRLNAERPLRPADFDYSGVQDCCESLLRGSRCEGQVYVRGLGWRDGRIETGDLVILDGLFLDSEEAASLLSYECGLVMQATDDVIAQWRRIRDEQTQQKQLGSTFRTWIDTEEEIRRTLVAERAYRRAIGDERLVYVQIDGVRAIELVW